MKILLAAINAKYIQTNLAVRLLHRYAQEQCTAATLQNVTIKTAEWNSNMSIDAVLRDVVAQNCDIVLFSVYIWNRTFVTNLANLLRRLSPNTVIGMGGPEVSFNAPQVLAEFPFVDCIMAGEGEETFRETVDTLSLLTETNKTTLRTTILDQITGMAGWYVRNENTFVFGGQRPLITDLGLLPFVYKQEYLDFDPTLKIVYYESSRGCPFSCAYCLSSTDHCVRFVPLDKVLSEITYFMDNEFPLIKFTDRTFNIRPTHYLSIWRHITAYYNNPNNKTKKITRFHFEIAAECLSEQALAVLSAMNPESIQLEIGIQSSHKETLQAVGRSTHTEILAERITAIPTCIHRHTDLIAGLPFESLTEFSQSFDYAFALHADMLQLGFLKILAGTKMETIAAKYTDYIYSPFPPYEILQTPWLSYNDVCQLKDIEYILDNYYNSTLLQKTFNTLCANAKSAFTIFNDAAKHLQTYFNGEPVQQPRRPATVFEWFASFCTTYPTEPQQKQDTIEWLKYDYFMQGKAGVIPNWMSRNYNKDRHFELAKTYLELQESNSAYPASARIIFGKTEYERFTFSDGTTRAALFVYTEHPTKIVWEE